jgi:ribokinase
MDSVREKEELLPQVSHLLLQNEIPFTTTIEYLADAAERMIQTVYNPSPMPSDEELRTFPWRNVTYLLVNEGEAQALLRALRAEITPAPAAPDGPLTPGGAPSAPYGAAVASATATVRTLTALPAFAETTVVCTLGGAGVLASIPRAPKLLYLPAVSLQGTTRDTTGAGDCFTGYFVAGLMRIGKQAPIAPSDAAELLRFSAQVCR